MHMDHRDGLTQLDAKQAKNRARWLRNKREARLRNQKSPPKTLCPEIIRQIWAERDCRAADYPGYLWNVRGWQYGRGTWEFQCDVWAVRTLLELQFDHASVTAGKVAHWMWENGLTHGYGAASLRTMAYRAYEAIKVLETIGGRRGQGPHWPRPLWINEVSPMDPNKSLQA